MLQHGFGTTDCTRLPSPTFTRTRGIHSTRVSEPRHRSLTGATPTAWFYSHTLLVHVDSDLRVRYLSRCLTRKVELSARLTKPQVVCGAEVYPLKEVLVELTRRPVCVVSRGVFLASPLTSVRWRQMSFQSPRGKASSSDEWLGGVSVSSGTVFPEVASATVPIRDFDLRISRQLDFDNHVFGFGLPVDGTLPIQSHASGVVWRKRFCRTEMSISVVPDQKPTMNSGKPIRSCNFPH